MNEYTVCQTKVHFDTEFEAERAVAIAEYRFGDELISYACGRHWHITHKDLDRRQGFGHRFKKCENCGEVVKRSEMHKHKCVTED